MISIIIPSRSRARIEALRKNIEQTIGVPFELLVYDNSENNYGICKIYNLSGTKSKFDNLVFCHDDVVFKTDNWGTKLIEIVQNTKIGLVGITGATYKSHFPAPWISIPKEYYRSNLYKGNDKIFFTKNEDYHKVAVIDGCFIAMRRNVFNKYQFNECDLKGFHLYDIDISLRVGINYKIVVAKTFFLEHLSEGNYDENWYKQSQDYHSSHKSLFEHIKVKKDVKEILDAYALRALIARASKLKMKRSQVFSYFWRLLRLKPSLLSIKMVRNLI